MLNKIKSRFNQSGLWKQRIFFELKNYLAAWIANFGVVPLFLFAAFLFAPAFFFFLNLLFVVTHVLETIRKLLFRNKSSDSLYSNFKPSFLPSKSLCVKLIFYSGLILTGSAQLGAKTLEPDYVVAKGQTLEISAPNLLKYNVENRDILKYHYDEKNRSLVIRGEKLGHSEILIWDHEQKMSSIQIFVVAKSQEAKFTQIAQLLNQIGLVAKLTTPHILVRGEIKNLAQYLNYKKLLSEFKDIIIDESELSLNVRNEIIGRVYKLFLEDFKESIRCESLNSEIRCTYPENEQISDSLKRYAENKFKINFIQISSQKKSCNYFVKLKLIQIEQLNGEEVRLGLEQINSNLGDFMKLPLLSIFQKNQVNLINQKLKMSTLAEPKLIVRPLSPAEIQIGAEIPYQSTGANNTQITEWKFAGLKIKITIENWADNLKINYETELTQPNTQGTQTGSISGNKGKSSVILVLNQVEKLFEISLKSEGSKIDQFPMINAIPILGELFKSKSTHDNFKTITGIIEVTENGT